jgi:hypothetical protein
MRVTRTALAVAAAALILGAGAAVAQDPGMPTPKPGPEHKLFHDDAGTWNATVEVFPAPGAPPQVSKGIENNTVGCEGLCLISDFKGEMAPGQKFHGHGTSAWDPAKKKYVGTWTDSMSTGISVGESTYDPATKTSTGWMEGPDPSGKVVKSKAVVQYKDPNTRVFTMYQKDKDGKEIPAMKITYSRQK